MMSVAIPPLAKRFKIGYIFMSFAMFTAIVSAFIALFMKETKGKTQAEIDELFDDSVKDTTKGKVSKIA